jgi:hypothetical protein
MLYSTRRPWDAEDYPYLAQNRDKLRRYVVEYILTGGGDTKKF